MQTSPACKKSRYQNRYAQPDVSAAFVDHAFQLLPFEENITGKKEKDKIKKDFDKSTKEFTIHAGEWSYRVSQKLENLGLVSDAKKFDQYLEDNGYSSKIKIGHYTISKDADFEEIAKEITSK